MDVAEHLEALRTEGNRLADAARRAAPGDPVPTCPAWDVGDLVTHTGQVHRWARTFISGGRTTVMSSDEEEEAMGPEPSDDHLVEWFAEGHADLVTALTDAPDDLECWTFLPSPSPRAFWARRQAHETAIHRVDAQTAIGAITPFAPAFAADGIDELLSGFFARRGRAPRIDVDCTLLISTTDTGETWFVQMGPAGYQATRDGGTADCSVSGPANDIYLLLWNRGTAGGLTVSGAPDVLDRWRKGATIRW
jgi:uncharacterized protein (TIGR03083 family)